MTELASSPAPDERIEADATRHFAMARALCIGCLSYHAVRPYLRSARAREGLAADCGVLQSVIAPMIAAGARRVLVAGAADTGLPSLALRAAGGRPISLTVVDRCATPLVQAQQLAARHGLRVATRQDDLTRFDLPDAFDLVIGHQVLPYIGRAGQTAFLSRVGRALAPGGRFVISVRDAAWRRWRDERFGGGAKDYPERFIAGLLARLAERPIALPEDRAAFDAILQAHAEGRRAVLQEHEPLEATLARFAAAGLMVERLLPVADARDIGGGGNRPESSGCIVVARATRHDERPNAPA